MKRKRSRKVLERNREHFNKLVTDELDAAIGPQDPLADPDYIAHLAQPEASAYTLWKSAAISLLNAQLAMAPLEAATRDAAAPFMRAIKDGTPVTNAEHEKLEHAHVELRPHKERWQKAQAAYIAALNVLSNAAAPPPAPGTVPA